MESMSPCRVGYTLQQLNTSQPISITVFLSIRIIPYIAKTERESEWERGGGERERETCPLMDIFKSLFTFWHKNCIVVKVSYISTADSVLSLQWYYSLKCQLWHLTGFWKVTEWIKHICFIVHAAGSSYFLWMKHHFHTSLIKHKKTSFI